MNKDIHLVFPEYLAESIIIQSSNISNNIMPRYEIGATLNILSYSELPF